MLFTLQWNITKIKHSSKSTNRSSVKCHVPFVEHVIFFDSWRNSKRDKKMYMIIFQILDPHLREQVWKESYEIETDGSNRHMLTLAQTDTIPKVAHTDKVGHR